MSHLNERPIKLKAYGIHGTLGLQIGW